MTCLAGCWLGFGWRDPDIRTQPDFETLLGTDGWLRLAPSIRRRFAVNKTRAHYVGTADLEASRLGRLIAWLVIPFGRPLPTGTGRQDAEIDLHPARGGVRWLRHYLRRTLGWECVASTKKIDSEGRLYECAGPLVMRLAVSEQAGAIIFDSDGFFLDIAGLKLPIPDLLTPGRIRVVHEDLGGDRFRFTLDGEHPLFGRTYRQVAVFRDKPVDHGDTPC